MKPVFCGNLEYDARPFDLERLFSRYGKVDRVDMKSGISKSVRALPCSWTLVHIPSSCQGSFFCQSISLLSPSTKLIHKWHSAFPSRDYYFSSLSCHIVKSPVSRMLKDRSHDPSPQSERSVNGEGTV